MGAEWDLVDNGLGLGGDISQINWDCSPRFWEYWGHPKYTPGLDSKGAAYDCQPTYIVKETVTSWFQTTHIEMGLCFSLCMDYPHCTTTAPLGLRPMSASAKNSTDDPELGLLLRCGLKSIYSDEDGTKVVELLGRNSRGKPTQVGV